MGESTAPVLAAGGRRQAMARAARTAGAVLRGPVSWSAWRAAANLVASLAFGAWAFVVLALALMAAGALSWVVGLGTLALTFAVRLAAGLAAVDRRRIGRLAGVGIEPAPLPRPAPGTTFRQRLRAQSRSAAARRLVSYQLVRLPAVAAEVFAVVAWYWTMIVAFVLPTDPRRANLLGAELNRPDLPAAASAALLFAGVVMFFAGPAVFRACSAADAWLGRALLGPRPSDEVQHLKETRALAVESANAERRRIERDLHDGVQPRLVSLALQLGLARARFDRDPEAARALLGDAHAQAKTALDDLRSLVRGIHPSVLDERGLDAALSALVAGCPVPVQVRVSVDRRPDPISESIAYFVAAEAIANVAKHSGASMASVTVTNTGGALQVLVEDDGTGGAVTAPGGGLAGLAARVGAVDGALSVTSPPGGPTRIEAVIPCGR
jgi:signal transduction histidine kinase